MKNSRFKFFLIPAENLIAEANELRPLLEKVLLAYDDGKINAIELSFLVIIVFCHKRRPHEWWMKGSSQLTFQKRSVGVIEDIFLSIDFPLRVQGMYDFFNNYRLKKMPRSIAHILQLWEQGRADIVFQETGSSPRQMLDMQCLGRRIVTLDRKALMQGLLVDGARDAFEFLLHDLAHAALFFEDHHQEQVDFFRYVQHRLEHHAFDKYLGDPAFVKDFDYVISDMNSCRIHLEGCLNAALIEADKRFSTHKDTSKVIRAYPKTLR